MDIFARVFFNIVVILFLVFLVYIFLFYLRKNSVQKGDALKVVERLNLDSRNALVLVRFKEKELLIFLSPSGGVAIDKSALFDKEVVSDT